MRSSIVSRKRLKQNILILFSLLVLIFTCYYLYNVYGSRGKSSLGERYISVVDYNTESELIAIQIATTGQEVACAVSPNEKEDNLIFADLQDGKCIVEIPVSKQYVYFKDKDGNISEGYSLDNIIVSIVTKDIYYIALDGNIDLNQSYIALGDYDLTLVAEKNDVLSIDGFSVKGIGVGESKLYFISNGQILKETNVVVTNTITLMPSEFDTKKPYLPCNQYSKDEADLLDKILADRVSEAGYGTRAGAVAAARFLTLEFPFRLTYFYENGRISGTSPNWADGEGRYYHEGLYLHEDKKKDMQYKVAGPAIWGCPLTNYEPDPPYFTWGVKYPNGLDCSGFVSWAMLNGGFDPGDIGAGESSYPYQLTDTGEFTELSDWLIQSGKIKVGDLFNTWGHISMLVGLDDDYFYIAESLNIYKGVVVKKYKKYAIYDYFQFVVLMDDYYGEDGNITDMWY